MSRGAFEKAAKDYYNFTVNTITGEYILRTEGRREQGLEFTNIPLKIDKDGSVVMLGDVADIHDGFRKSQSFFSYNGAPGMILYVYQSKNHLRLIRYTAFLVTQELQI